MRKLGNDEFLFVGYAAIGAAMAIGAPLSDDLPPLVALLIGAAGAAILVLIYITITSLGKVKMKALMTMILISAAILASFCLSAQLAGWGLPLMQSMAAAGAATIAVFVVAGVIISIRNSKHNEPR